MRGSRRPAAFKGSVRLAGGYHIYLDAPSSLEMSASASPAHLMPGPQCLLLAVAMVIADAIL